MTPSEPAPTAATVDPRDEAIATEVAYRMQADWTGLDMQRATVTAAALARAEGRQEVIAWLSERSQRALVVDGLVFEARLRFGFEHRKGGDCSHA